MTDDRLADLLLGHLHREYPTKPGHILASADEVVPVAELSPVFRGSFDWHSSVHSHWAALALLGEPTLSSDRRRAIESALAISFTAERVTAELDQLDRPHRRGFELPYGIAWLLTLAAELDCGATSWTTALDPLRDLAIERFAGWLRALPGPIRSGEHSCSAFSMSLALAASRQLAPSSSAASALVALIEDRARDFYLADQRAPIAWEPSAYDFLSPALAEAELMQHVLPIGDAADWLESFLPGVALEPVVASDRDDGKLAHADGLNLSRAWMLESLSKHRPALAERGHRHWRAGIAGLEAASYAGSHWLPTFVVYGRRRGATLA